MLMKLLRSLWFWLRGDVRGCGECRYAMSSGADLYCHYNPPTRILLNAEQINVGFPIVLPIMKCSKGRR